MRHLPAAIVTAALLLGAPQVFGPILGEAQAATAPLDRSQLSLDENVLINQICGAVRSQGGQGAYDGCVAQQLAGLAAHPSPDRSGLSPERNLALERACDYVKHVAIGDYNACLDKTLAAQKAAGKVDETNAGSLAQVFAPTGPDTAKPEITPPKRSDPVKPASVDAKAGTELPRPQEILAKRPAATERAALSPEALYKAVEKSVFVVLAAPSLADAKARNIVQGSAVAVTENLLLTNCHVVLGRSLIKLIQDQTLDDATLVAAEPQADRCVIKSSKLKLTPVIGVSSFDSLSIGERAFAIGAPRSADLALIDGTPRSLERSLSEGLVSGLHHQSTRNMVQTSAPVSPGSSGGGLFDERGNLIGITTLASNGGTQNLNFAIAAADYWN